MKKVLALFVVLLAFAGVLVGMQWNTAKAIEAEVYARTATPETAHEYGEWAETLKSEPTLHLKLHQKLGPFRAHLAERQAQHEAYQAALAEAAKKAAEEEAAKRALTPEQRRAKWLEEYGVSAAKIPEATRAAMTTLLTRANFEQRGVVLVLEKVNGVGEVALKKALEAVDTKCQWDLRTTQAPLELVATGDPAVEGIRIRFSWVDAKEPLEIEVHEKNAKKKAALKLARVRVSLDMRAPNAQPMHVEEEAALDTGDLAKRIKKNPSIADVYAAEAASLVATACGTASGMLGLRDP